MRPSLYPRQDCSGGQQFFLCASNGFRGCCSVDPCSLPNGCPDADGDGSGTTSAGGNGPSSASSQSTTTTVAVASTPAGLTASPLSTEAPPTTTIPTSNSSSVRLGPAVSSISTESSESSQSTSLTHATSSSLSTLETSRPGSTTSTKSHSSVPVGAVVGAVIGALILGVLIALFIVYLRRRRRVGPRGASDSPVKHFSILNFDAKRLSFIYLPSLPTPFWKLGSKSPINASPVAQIDGFPVQHTPGGNLVELEDTSAPAELADTSGQRTRRAGGGVETSNPPLDMAHESDE